MFDKRNIRIYYLRTLEKIRSFLLSRNSREFLIFLFFVFVSFCFWLLQILNDDYETEFSIPQEQAEKRSGCLKPGNGFLSVGRAAETFPLRHQRRLFHVLIRPAHPGIFLSYAEARLSRRRAQKSKASVLSRTPCWIGRDQ